MARRDFSTIVVVPGIMGSELRLQEVGISKTVENRVIWGEELDSIWGSLARQPHVLSSSNIKATKILRTIKGYPFNGKRDLYGKLLEHLADKYNLTEGENLFGFGYDWRQDNRESAKRLGEFLRKRTGLEDRIVIIAHSMGGLVARSLLADNDFSDLHPRIAKMIQLGTPVLGSAKAFFTLKNRHRINWFFDAMIYKRQKRHPELYHNLYSSLEKFYSLFQLLPPKTEQIVFDESGTQFSALDESLWDADRRDHLDCAAALHAITQSLTSEIIFALYSTKVDTERAYMIDDAKAVKNICQPLVYGDGTVSVASASAATSLDNRTPFDDIEHDVLPGSKKVWESLEKLL